MKKYFGSFLCSIVVYFFNDYANANSHCIQWRMQGVKVVKLGRQNESNSSCVWLAHTSVFGLYFISVCLMKSNCSLICIFFFGEWIELIDIQFLVQFMIDNGCRCLSQPEMSCPLTLISILFSNCILIVKALSSTSC